MGGRRLWFLCLLLCAARAAADAPAADARLAAQRHLERGLHEYDVQDYATAIAEFRAGYRLDPRPELLYALAQAERKSGDCRAAIEAYQAFLRSRPPPLQEESARKNISRCRELLANTPDETAAAPGRPSGAEAQAQAPPPTSPSLSPSPLASAPSPSPPPPVYRDRAGWILVGSGVALAAGGGALWGVAQHAIDRVDGATDYGEFARLADANGGAEWQRALGIAVVAAGGALVLAGAIRFGWKARQRR